MKMTIIGGAEYENGGTHKFEYNQEVPEGLDVNMYWLIAQGILFENDWCSADVFFEVRFDRNKLT